MGKYTSKGVKMAAKFATRCAACKAAIPAGTAMVFYAGLATGHRTWHVECARVEALTRQSFALGLKSIQDDFNESYWLARQAAAEAEIAALRPLIAARAAA